MIALIDADSLAYIIGWHCKDLEQIPQSYIDVVQRTDDFITDILDNTKATNFLGFLGGVHPTFRHIADPKYKANRGLTKPDWYMQWGGVINHRLFHRWNFKYVEGMEAEDAVSMMAYYYRKTLNFNHIICHIDKDLDQIVGDHYNYKTKVSYQVSELEAISKVAFLMLVGDPVDNVLGIAGIGKVTANRIIQTAINDSKDVLTETLKTYQACYGDRAGVIKFTEAFNLVKLLDKPELGFKPSSDEYKFKSVTQIDELLKQHASINYFDSPKDEQTS